jgi:acetyl-CoA decarbonylase/synthase complex subunit gamma
MGLMMAGILSYFRAGDPSTLTGLLEMAAWFFVVTGVSAFLAMDFTGASTYTSLSGVKREMKWAVPFEIGAVGFGIVFIIGAHVVS